MDTDNEKGCNNAVYITYQRCPVELWERIKTCLEDCTERLENKGTRFITQILNEMIGEE